MDEIYYVPAAQALLAGEKCGPYLDNCNLEHPFLSKAIIAAGIAIFGNNDFGWRFFEVLLGTVSVPVLFAICWSLTRDSTLSLFAAFLLAFETLFFVQSSIAVIDIQMIFFALLAFIVYLAKLRIWKLDRVTLAAPPHGARRPLQGDRRLPRRVPRGLQPPLRDRQGRREDPLVRSGCS